MFSNLFIFSDLINFDSPTHKIKTDRNYSDSPVFNFLAGQNFQVNLSDTKTKMNAKARSL